MHEPSLFEGFAALGVFLSAPTIGRLILPRPNMNGLSVFALWTAVGIAALSFPLLLLAYLGWFDTVYCGLLGWSIFAALTPWSTATRTILTADRWSIATLLLFVSILAFNINRTSESIYGGRDQGVYSNQALNIYRTGGIDVAYPFPPSEFPSPITVNDLNGFGMHPLPNHLQVQFSQLFPVWLAQAYGALGFTGLFSLNALLSFLSILLFYDLLQSNLGRCSALLFSIILAISPAQLWISRITLSEPLAQLFFLAATALVYLRGNLRVSLVAAGLLAVSALARVDMFLLLPAFVCTLTISRFLSHISDNKEYSAQSWGSESLALATTIFFLIVFFVYDYAFSIYFSLFRHKILIAFAGLIATITLLVALRAFPIFQLSQRIRRLFWILITATLIFAASYCFFIRPNLGPYAIFQNTAPGWPLEGMRSYREFSLRNISHYVSVPILLLSVIGLTDLIYRWIVDLKPPKASFLTLTGCVFSILYFFDPHISPDHPWAIRRFVPVVLPFLVFAASFGVETLSKAVRIPTFTTMLKVALSVYFCFFSLVQNRVLAFTKEYEGTLKFFQTLAQALPDNLPIICLGSSQWTAPLLHGFGKPIIVVNLKSERGFKWMREFLERRETQHHVVLANSSFNLPQALETGPTFTWKEHFIVPENIAPVKRTTTRSRRIVMFHSSGIEDYLAPSLESLGTRTIPSVFESGWHSGEGTDVNPFRWTNGYGHLEIPLSHSQIVRSIHIEAAAHHPKGGNIRIYLNGVEVHSAFHKPGPFKLDITLNPELRNDDKLILEIISQSFVPSDFIKGSRDKRQLGVCIKNIKLHYTER